MFVHMVVLLLNMLSLVSDVVMANCVLFEGSSSTSRRSIVLSLSCMPVMVVYNMKEYSLGTITLIFKYVMVVCPCQYLLIFKCIVYIYKIFSIMYVYCTKSATSSLQQ